MTNAERQLLQQINGSNNMESIAGSSYSSGIQASLGNVRGNPQFKAQFDLTVRKIYQGSYRKVGDVADTYVLPNGSNMPNGEDKTLAVYIFGNSDFAGSYAKSRQLLNEGCQLISVSVSQNSGISGKVGDLVFEYDILPNNRAAYISYDITVKLIISCEQVAYGTLLDSISSDRFNINTIRYSVPTGQEKQFGENISLIRQSLFGKVANDFVSPQSFQNSMDYQKNIVDIPLSVGVDKNLVLATYMPVGVTSFRWTVFVSASEKLVATPTTK